MGLRRARSVVAHRGSEPTRLAAASPLVANGAEHAAAPENY